MYFHKWQIVFTFVSILHQNCQPFDTDFYQQNLKGRGQAAILGTTILAI